MSNNNNNTVLSGVQPSGDLHIGNYLGAIKNFVNMQNNYNCFFCIVDLHAITVKQDPKILKRNTLEVAATYIASGIDPKNSVIFNQSSVSAHSELAWIFNCVTRMGWLNRMTQFKDKAGKDKENASSGLFIYPNLMAADILMFDSTHVPVGSDQMQHLEMTRDIAARFNHLYKPLFTLPEPIIDNDEKVVPGLDGRKMSKSYNNVIPLLCDEKTLRKSIMKIVTNSLEPGEPKDYKTCNVFSLYTNFASDEEIAELKEEYNNGISWGDAKNKLFDKANDSLLPIRERYFELKEQKDLVKDHLSDGAKKVRPLAQEFIEEIRSKIGIS